MDTKEIIQAISEKDNDVARQKVVQSLNEKAIEAMKARKEVIASTFFHPKD